jgi:hypothetical protein
MQAQEPTRTAYLTALTLVGALSLLAAFVH